MADNTISYEEFTEIYQPLDNHLNAHAPLEGHMFETYGPELEHVLTIPQNRVWTYVQGDGDELLLQSGYHIVNRLGYIITEQPCPEGDTVTVEFDDVWERAGDYIENYLLSDDAVGNGNHDKDWFIIQCKIYGDLAAAAIHLLHTSYRGQYDPVSFANQINNVKLEDVYGQL